MAAPSVSAIIPSHNAALFLADAIHSVLAQTEAAEIIVVNDGSTDATADVIASFGDQIRAVYQPQLGLGGARNRGVRESRGEFVAFLDADDLWSADKTEMQSRVLRERPEIDMVFGHGCEFSDPEGAWPARTEAAPTYLGSAIMLRRSLFDRIGGFFEERRVGEFIDWYSRAEADGAQSVLLPEVVFHRRVHANNMTRTSASRKDEYLDVLRAHLQRRRG